VKKSEMFSTAVDEQTNVEIHILQGERELVSGNKSLGNFRLDGIPPADRGVPQIEVTFDIDVDGILSVKAREKETGVEQSVTIQGASNLSESEVDNMLQEAEKFAAADKQKKENIDLKNQAEALCFEAEKELNLVKETISEDKQQTINDLISSIRQEIQSDNIEALKSKLDDLKTNMKDLIAAKVGNNAGSDPMSDLNDL
jgi:molecular chaperone DnaK